MQIGILMRLDMSTLMSAALGDLAIGDVERCRMRYRGVTTAYASIWIRRPETIILFAIKTVTNYALWKIVVHFGGPRLTS